MSQNHRPDPNEHAPSHRPELERMVRCAADGELPHEDVQQYESAKAADPTLERFEQSERDLRSAVGRCMGNGYACPPALRDRIVAMAAGLPADAEPPLHLSDAPDRAPDHAQPEPANPLRFPVWQRVAAFAAAVAIIIAVSSYFRQNPSTQQPGGPGVALAGDAPSGVQLAGFMSGEHNRCASHPGSIRKFTEQDLARVPAAFQDVLGTRVQPEDLLPEGATFIAAGKCKVPGKGPSIHMMYQAFDQAGQPVDVSLYIQRCGDPRFESGKAYAVGAQGEGSSNIIGWRHDELLYYLVTTSADTTKEIAGQMQAPDLAGAI